MTRYLRDLSLLAPAMEAVSKQERAKVFYDLFSGSLVWTDELPKRPVVSLDCLRFVLKHRTGLITGKLEPNYELFWNEAQAQFPKWIGFSADRTAYNPSLVEFYLTEQAKALEN